MRVDSALPDFLRIEQLIAARGWMFGSLAAQANETRSITIISIKSSYVVFDDELSGAVSCSFHFPTCPVNPVPQV